ncbi:Hypothetical predicted protein [Paramuricea clavata]|uniref:Paraneoplastic antigen Ma-like C-terminal domain-containing protein n=1 Tax=Paramuricea clavata TaxID=317549 RepID=A0A7D9DBY2_PARCT|nr:Hypothetical predicted protein [Paramuricea clavata]
MVSKGVTNEQQKVALLLHSKGMELQELYYTLKPVSEDNNLQECLNALDAYFTPKVNVAFERHMFRQMQQKENETIDQFVCRLRQKCISCEFTNVDEAIRDQIIEKCRDPKLRRKFLEKTGTVTLSVLQDMARVHETVNTQMQSMDRSGTNQVHGILQGNRRGKGKYGAKSDDRASHGNHKEGHIRQDKSCPAISKTCKKCGLVGHFAVCCRTKAPKKPSNGKQCQDGSYQVEEEKQEPETDNYAL